MFCPRTIWHISARKPLWIRRYMTDSINVVSVQCTITEASDCHCPALEIVVRKEVRSAAVVV